MYDLASNLRSLEIEQLQVNHRDERSPSGPHLLGIQEGDWAAIIIAMFSKRLDKLRIVNNYSSANLSLEHTDKLIEVYFSSIEMLGVR